jgi:predicted membrane channel-forming protein YqfA (hemolysin III family)
MKLTEPRNITFIIAVLIGLIGILAFLVEIPVLTPIAFWLVVIGFVILVVGNLVKGL